MNEKDQKRLAKLELYLDRVSNYLSQEYDASIQDLDNMDQEQSDYTGAILYDCFEQNEAICNAAGYVMEYVKSGV